MHVSLRRVAGYPAVVVVGRSDHAILKEWREKTWTNVLRTFVITALAAVLLIAFLRQLARHERVTAQLHQSQKLEALGTLAGGIAHDFNNVLGAILGYGELAIEHTAAGSNQRRYLDNIVVAANRARELVARILAFSRPGVGSATPARAAAAAHRGTQPERRLLAGAGVGRSAGAAAPAGRGRRSGRSCTRCSPTS